MLKSSRISGTKTFANAEWTCFVVEWVLQTVDTCKIWGAALGVKMYIRGW